MSDTAADLARRLAAQAECVCRHYLSNGRREGRTWRVGNIANTPGRSLCVQLTGTSKGAAGRWIDFATGEYGDLIDLIARTRCLGTFRDALDEARRFLSLPQPRAPQHHPPALRRSPEAARRLFASAGSIHGTTAATYLRSRGITDLTGCRMLRFHPRCWYRAHDTAPRESWPALIAAVTDLNGRTTGVQRTWLARDGSGKAPLATPRRAMGQLAGNGVRFGMLEPAHVQAGVLAAGEGLETMLGLRQSLPTMPMVAALSAAHLAALILHPGLRRLYVARDNDPAGHRAADKLLARARSDRIEALLLTPSTDDFDTDLRTLGREVLSSYLRAQLAPEDIARFVDVEHLTDRRSRPRSLPSGSSSPSAAPGLHQGDRARSG
jgi:hypothetical protein